MLGTIARKLRILGFDCRYSATINDEDVLLLAKREGRIIITRDQPLAANAKKHDIVAVYLTKRVEKEQIAEIAAKLNLGKYSFREDSARCSMCNGNLHLVEKDQVADKIPPRTAQNTEKFWACDECGHIYWVGTHIRNLEELISEINEKL